VTSTGVGLSRRSRKRPGLPLVERIGNAALTIASIFGAVCIALVALAFFFNITLIMFKTGSMSPTMPTGTLAVVREIPATEIQVGDVVSVDRENILPITHRVTSVTDGPAGSQRLITMKGDANPTPDPAPYTVETVRKVIAAVPNLAYAVIWLSNPWVLGTLAIGASILVTWAFWPKKGPKNPALEGSTGRRRRKQAGETAPPSHPTSSSVTAILLMLIIATGSAVVVDADAAHADSGEEVRSSAHLTVTSIADPAAMAAISPGAATEWQVGVSADGRDPGEVIITLAGGGEGDLGLSAEVAMCDTRWVNGSCDGDPWSIDMPEVVSVDGVHRLLETMPTGHELWLRIVVSLPADTAADPGDSVQLTVRVMASGETLETGPQQVRPLAETGAPLLPPLLVALSAIFVGLLVAGTAALTRRGMT
jgi:signal peptidase